MADGERGGGPERRKDDVLLAALGKYQESTMDRLNKMHIEVTDRLARIETKQEAMVPRCNSHAVDIEALAERSKTIEEAIGYSKDGDTINDRTKSLEKRRDSFDGALWLITKVSAAAAAVYGALVFLAKTIVPHSDKVIK